MPRGKAKESSENKTAEEILAELQANGLKIGLDIPVQQWYSTGNMAIDSITGGGIPVGRIVTLAGSHAAGKTTASISAARSVIEQGRRVIFCDYERTLDKPYFRSLGVDPDDSRVFVRFNPRTLEEGFNAIRKLVETGDFGMTIVDSIPAMTTVKERGDDISSGMNLELPKLLRVALKQANDYCYEYDSTLILLNHLMEKVDITFMGQQLAARGIKQYTMPGGTGPYFYSSMILWFTKKGAVTAETYDPLTNAEHKQKIGFEHVVSVYKNKVAKPDGEAVVINILGEGFSNNRTAFELLKAHGHIKKNGAWFSVKNAKLLQFVPNQVQGEENFYQALFGSKAGAATAVTISRDILQQAYEQLDSSPDEDVEDQAVAQ